MTAYGKYGLGTLGSSLISLVSKRGGFRIGERSFPARCPVNRKGGRLLTEQEVSKSWRNLFGRGELSDDMFVKAEALIDELRGESPLRHRLTTELDELRRKWKVSQAV